MVREENAGGGIERFRPFSCSEHGGAGQAGGRSWIIGRSVARTSGPFLPPPGGVGQGGDAASRRAWAAGRGSRGHRRSGQSREARPVGGSYLGDDLILALAQRLEH